MPPRKLKEKRKAPTDDIQEHNLVEELTNVVP